MTATVPDSEAGIRLDVYAAALLGVSRAGAQKYIENGAVRVNGLPAPKNRRLESGDVIEAVLPDPEPIEAQPQDIPLDVLYEDGELLVVNKPQGMVVHPAPGNPDGTLVNALLAHCGDSLSSINGKLRPGIVHRIDKDTSGLLIVAKTDRAHRGLAEQIASHSFGRRYDAVLVGTPREERGTVDAPVGRHPTDRKRMAVNVKNGKRAVTDYAVTEHFCRMPAPYRPHTPDPRAYGFDRPPRARRPRLLPRCAPRRAVRPARAVPARKIYRIHPPCHR